MNPSFYVVPENKSGEMDWLPIPGDYGAECFPLAKSGLTLAPLIPVLLIRLLLLTSSALLAQLHLVHFSFSLQTLYLRLSELTSFTWFMQAEFKEQWKKDWVLDIIRLEMIQKSLGKKEHWTLDMLCFLRFQNPATKMDPLQYSHWLNPLLGLFKMHSFTFVFIHLSYDKCVPNILQVLL